MQFCLIVSLMLIIQNINCEIDKINRTEDSKFCCTRKPTSSPTNITRRPTLAPTNLSRAPTSEPVSPIFTPVSEPTPPFGEFPINFPNPIPSPIPSVEPTFPTPHPTNPGDTLAPEEPPLVHKKRPTLFRLFNITQ